VLAVLGALQSAGVGVADEPTIEPYEAPSGFAWRPSTLTLSAGGTVAFRNPSNIVPHGLAWTGGPEKPSCNGIPVDGSGTAWSGSCSFAQAGAYSFVCTVHPEEMKGTITVNSSEAQPAPPTGPGQPPAPAEGPLVEALRLPKDQHGMAVRGSIAVSQAGAGGRLSIELEAKRASLGQQSAGRVRVGKLTRSLASPGRVHFAVPLKASAQRALRRRGRLPLTVKTVVTPPSGTVTAMTRRVELHE
jgi:plastocyanin